MDFNKTTPETLSKIILENISKPVTYSAVSINGAEKAATIIQNLLQESKES